MTGKFFKKHPKLTRFIWGDICPKCKGSTLMTLHTKDCMECPVCGYKVRK